jgi:hypothetical protein
MVSGNWSYDNIVYKMFAIDLLHKAWSYYYGYIMTFFFWMTSSVSEDDTWYGSMEWWINEMKWNLVHWMNILIQNTRIK